MSLPARVNSVGVKGQLMWVVERCDVLISSSRGGGGREGAEGGDLLTTSTFSTQR